MREIEFTKQRWLMVGVGGYMDIIVNLQGGSTLYPNTHSLGIYTMQTWRLHGDNSLNRYANGLGP